MSEKIKSFIGKFTVLRTAVRELWIIYAAKFWVILAYGMLSSTLVLWLSSDLGFSDSRAGYIIAMWSTLLSLFTVLSGSLVDAIGIRTAFLMGFWVCLFSRIILTFSATKWIALPFGLVPLALGEALMVPVMVAAVKRYSNTSQRSIAFAMFYAVMNVGFAVSGWMFDFIRGRLGEYGSYIVPVLGSVLSTYRTMFLWSLILTVPGLIMVYLFLREGVEVTDEGVKIIQEKPKYADYGIVQSFYLMCCDTVKDTSRIFASLWKETAFYKFLAFLSLVVGVRLINYHMFYTFPKYGIRELGEGAPIGRLYSVLNPVLIIFLVPLAGALTQKISAYRMVSLGSIVSALSVFFIALPPEWFVPLANGWLGDLIAHKWLGMQGPVNPLYVSITFFVILLSIGEALWSPRLYEYPAAIAPKGKEGSYMALSILPYFVAKFFVGMLSGLLLEKYCPAQGARNSQMIWLVIGCLALITPVGLLTLRKFIQVKEEGR